MNSEELEKHMIEFQKAYAMFPAIKDEKRRVAWAERVASSVGLRAIYSEHGRPLSARPFEPADYTDDHKRPLKFSGDTR